MTTPRAASRVATDIAAGARSFARRCARLAADPLQPDDGADPGDRRGADGLARAAAARRLGARAQPDLRLHLTGIGLVTASSPMIATALGERSNTVRDVRRTLPPVAVADRHCHLAADLADAVERRSRSSLRSARSRRWPRDAGISCAATCGRCCRSCCSRRCATSSPRSERPGWMLVVSVAGIVSTPCSAGR